jgi:hypothetical protein
MRADPQSNPKSSETQPPFTDDDELTLMLFRTGIEILAERACAGDTFAKSSMIDLQKELRENLKALRRHTKCTALRLK